jgi:hypothetical protein
LSLSISNTIVIAVDLTVVDVVSRRLLQLSHCCSVTIRRVLDRHSA